MFFRNVPKELAKYIKEHMKLGHSLDDIKSHLTAHGHNLSDIKIAISLVSKDYELNAC